MPRIFFSRIALAFSGLLLAGTLTLGVLLPLGADDAAEASVQTHSASATDVQHTRHILIIHSENQYYSHYLDVTGAFIQTLRTSPHAFVFHHVDLMADRNDSPQVMADRLLPYHANLRDGNYAAVVTIGDEASDYIMHAYQKINPLTRLISIGRSYKPEALHADRVKITGNEQPDYACGTLDLAMHMLPERKEIFFLSDARKGGRHAAERIQKRIQEHYSHVKFTPFFSEKIAEPELFIRLKSRSKDSILIYHSWRNLELNKSHTDYTEFLSDLIENEQIPIFVLKQKQLQYGILGGDVFNGVECGEKGARTLLDALRGVTTSGASMETLDPHPTVNYGTLKMMNLPAKCVPLNARYFDRPESFFSRHQAVILISIASIIALLVAFLSLTFLKIHAKREESRMNVIYRRLPISFYVCTVDGDILNSTQGGDLDGGIPAAPYRRLAEIPDIPLNKVLELTRTVLLNGKMESIEYTRHGRGKSAFCYKLPYELYNRETVIWIAQDTTALQKSRAEARRTANSFKLMLNAMKDGVILTDELLRITSLNPAAEAWASGSEIIGKRLGTVFPLRDAANGTPLASCAESVLQTGKSAHSEHTADLLLPNGNKLHIGEWVFPLTNKASGTVEGTVVILRDITEEAERLHQIRRQKSQMQMMAEMAEIVYFTVVSGDPSAFCLSNTDARYWGHGQNFKPLSVAQWVHPDDQSAFLMTLQSVADTPDVPKKITYRAGKGGGFDRFEMRVRAGMNPYTNKLELFGIIRADFVKPPKKDVS